MSPYFAKAVEEDFENAEERVCEWTHVTGFYYKPKCYEELAFHYKEGITLWCPYCGKPIKVVTK